MEVHGFWRPWLLEALACGGPYTVLWVSETFVVCCFSRVHCTGQRSTATRRSMDHSVLNCCLPRMLTLTSPSASSSSAIMAGSVTTGITDFFWSKTLLSHVFCLIFTSLCQAWILALLFITETSSHATHRGMLIHGCLNLLSHCGLTSGLKRVELVHAS